MAHGQVPVHHALARRSLRHRAVKDHVGIAGTVLLDPAVLPVHPRRGAQCLGNCFLGGKAGGQGPHMQIAFCGNEESLAQRRGPLQLRLEARDLHNVNTNSHDHAFEFIGFPKEPRNARYLGTFAGSGTRRSAVVGYVGARAGRRRRKGATMDATKIGTEPSAITLLRDGLTRVHEGIEALLEEAEPRMLRFRASAASNPVAWLIWHLSRIQDDHFAHLARALDPDSTVEQCWTAREWVSRFSLPYAPMDTGYGHSREQVADFGMYDGEHLRGYHADVHSQSMDILGTLGEGDLATIIDRRWDPPVSAGVRLVSVLGETTAHLGQAQFVRGIFREENKNSKKDA